MKYLIVIPALLVLAVPVQAQEQIRPITPRVELFAGASISQLNVWPNNFIGGQTAVDVNLNHFFALTGDFGFQRRIYHGFPINTGEIAGGPEFRFRHFHRIRQTLFVHVLVGEQRDGVGFGTLEVLGRIVPYPRTSNHGLAVLGGGGSDIRLSQRFAIRITADYVGTRFYQRYDQRYVRVGAGLVLRFGGPKIAAFKEIPNQDVPAPVPAPIHQWLGLAGS